MKRFVCLIALLTMMTGCNTNLGEGNAEMNDTGGTVENIASVIATEETVPTDYYEEAFHRQEPPGYVYLVRQATNQEQYENLWAKLPLQEKAPAVDFDENSVVFFSLQESSSCPTELSRKNLQANSATETLEIEVSVAEDIEFECTADAVGRTLIIEVNEEAGSFKNAKIYENKTETTVPVK